MTNTVEELLSNVVGVVEATSYERMCLWNEYHEERHISWEQNCSGFLVTIGRLDGRPVVLSLLVNTVNGYPILFIEATSMVVDHQMLEDWLNANLPSTAFKDDGKYLNKENAMNFHNVLPRE
jgi:hypothetical protein